MIQEVTDKYKYNFFWNRQVLTKIDAFLADLLEFNKAIVQFDSVLTGLDSWINGKGQVCQSCHQTPLANVI